MTQTSPFLAVGHVKDAHGIKGEIYVRLFAGRADWLSRLKEVRLKSRESGDIKTFKIVRVRPHKEGLIFVLEGLVDRNMAEALKGYTFEIPEETLISAPGEGIYLHEVLGFEVCDEKMGILGPVKSFSSNGPQDLLVVQYGAREELIPFIKPFIQNIDFQNRRICMVLPDGLIDITLSE